MKVLTSNPVYINDTQIDKPSEYLSFDGGNTEQVKAFQDWMDLEYPGWYRGGNMNRGKKYGKMDFATKKANRKYGSQFDQLVGGGSRKFLGTVNPHTGEFTPPPGYSETAPNGETRAGRFWNKAKGGWEKAETALQRVQGFMDKVNQFGQMFGGGRQEVQPDWNNQPTFEPEEKKMSKGLKIGLIIGGVALAGVVVFAIVKHSKKSKSKKA